MKFILLAVFLIIDPVKDINKIARTNQLKKEAKEAYTSGNYEKAIKTYHYLLDSMNVDEDEIRLNLANSYYQKRDTASAVNYYNELTVSDKNRLSSIAHQQLGIIKNKQKQHKEALEDFKQALRKDPYNEEARYNYELLKKLLNEKNQDQDQQQKDQDKKKDQEQKQDQQQQNQQDKKDQQDQQDQQEQEQKQDQQKDQEGKQDEQEQKDQQKKDEQKPGENEEEQKKNEGKPEKPSDEKKDNQEQMPMNSDKMKELKISEEKAKMILEAMKNQEIQYLQQRIKKAKERPPSDKPDW